MLSDYCLYGPSVGIMFNVGRKLGSGGFGTVYSATRKRDKRLVRSLFFLHVDTDFIYSLDVNAGCISRGWEVRFDQL